MCASVCVCIWVFGAVPVAISSVAHTLSTWRDIVCRLSSRRVSDTDYRAVRRNAGDSSVRNWAQTLWLWHIGMHICVPNKGKLCCDRTAATRRRHITYKMHIMVVSVCVLATCACDFDDDGVASLVARAVRLRFCR